MNVPIYTILIHYSEIALKKNNRSFFEKIFIKNIKLHLSNLPYSSIRLVAARVIINDINFSKWDKYKNCLKNVMGMKNATLMIKTTTKISDMKKNASLLIKDLEFDSFRISTKRHYKKSDYDSQQINALIGEHIQKKTNKEVNLSNPDCNVIIEALKDNSYIGIEKFIGYSGLPANCQEKAISLISSGIDSPVASFEMIKRGVNVSYIHFHSFPAINRQSIDNVEKLLNVLCRYQLKSTLYLVPLLELQQKIMKDIPDKYWVIFFRRLMIRIANDIAQKINGVALITGDSIGQVASQTLSNIRAISDVSQLPVIRPLSGYNKEDIINKAKQIGTYDISIEPYEDCCSFFVPSHPETKAKIEKVNELHKNLKLDELYSNVFKKIEKKEFKYT